MWILGEEHYPEDGRLKYVGRPERIKRQYYWIVASKYQLYLMILVIVEPISFAARNAVISDGRTDGGNDLAAIQFRSSMRTRGESH